MMFRTTAALSLSAIMILGAETASATEISEITDKDYYAASYYKDALEDPRIQKVKKQSKKIRKIARSIGISAKQLKAAIAKMGGLSGEPTELAVAAIKAGFEESRVKGRVLDVLINAEEAKHVVVYVRWRASKSKDVVKDASAIAHAVVSRAPLVSTLSLSAIHPKAPSESRKSVWSGKIGHGAMERISPKRIEDYADRLYKRLFEGVEERPF